MADLPFFVELNEQNLTETLQRSVETPLVINFYAPSHKESADFAKVLQRVAEQHKGRRRIRKPEIALIYTLKAFLFP